MLEKTGTPTKILEVAESTKKFGEMWEKIEKCNNLTRCTSCKHLLSKTSDGMGTFKHKKMAILFKGEADVLCPICGTINRIKP